MASCMRSKYNLCLRSSLLLSPPYTKKTEVISTWPYYVSGYRSLRLKRRDYGHMLSSRSTIGEREYGTLPPGPAPTFLFLWRGILQATDIIRAGSDFSLGDGSKILFDRWCDGVKLEEMFPFIARIASDSCCVVADVFQDSPTEGSWCPRFRRGGNFKVLSFVGKSQDGGVNKVRPCQRVSFLNQSLSPGNPESFIHESGFCLEVCPLSFQCC